MTIDERALAAAIDEFFRVRPHEVSTEDLLRHVLKIYEAARWRPIVQLPRDVSFIGPISGGDLHVSVMTDQGEFFCKIDPPTK